MASDPRLLFPESPTWRAAGSKQNILGSELVIYEPNTPKWDDFPAQLEFELASNRAYLFGPLTRFNVYGTFQKQETENGNWVPMAAGDEEKVMLAPNWWELLYREIAVYQGNKKICTTDEAQHIWPHLNAYLLGNMDKLSKKVLCPHPASPGHCVPGPNKLWNHDSAEWKDYGKQVFCNASFNFDYTPLHVFPFFQNADSLVGGKFPCAVPMSLVGKLEVRLTFNSNQDAIFKKKTPTDITKYRFDMEMLQLCIEEARLSPAYEKQLSMSKRALPYAGVTKLMLAETIPASNMYHKTRFDDIPTPEGLFVFALPKETIGGAWKFDTNTDGKVFRPLNIREMSLSYNNDTYAHREPNLGMVENKFMEVKQYFDHLISPPFGMPLDPDKVTLDMVKNCGSASAYPHVYINLCNFADKSRLVPANQDGSILSKNADLDIQIKFGSGGASENVTYFFYLFYTDVNQMLDLKSKTFSSPYNMKLS